MIRKEQLSKECVGISSKVISDIQNNLHVLFYDIEGQMFKDVKREIEARHDNYMIFKSSPFNFHVIVPEVKSKKKVKYFKRNLEMDDKTHLKVGDKNDSWILRISEKGDKSNPVLVDYNIVPRKPNTTFSKPHLDIIEHLYKDFSVDVPERKTVGRTLRIDNYWTY